MKPNIWKCFKNKQLSTKQPSRWAQKGNGIRENIDSSKSPTLTLFHSWTKTKKQSKAKQSKDNTDKTIRDMKETQTIDTK